MERSIGAPATSSHGWAITIGAASKRRLPRPSPLVSNQVTSRTITLRARADRSSAVRAQCRKLPIFTSPVSPTRQGSARGDPADRRHHAGEPAARRGHQAGPKEAEGLPVAPATRRPQRQGPHRTRTEEVTLRQQRPRTTGNESSTAKYAKYAKKAEGRRQPPSTDPRPLIPDPWVTDYRLQTTTLSPRNLARAQAADVRRARGPDA